MGTGKINLLFITFFNKTPSTLKTLARSLSSAKVTV